MICPICNHPEHRVIRSRDQRRVRKCERCRSEWTTTEVPELEIARLRRIEESARRLKADLAEEV